MCFGKRKVFVFRISFVYFGKKRKRKSKVVIRLIRLKVIKSCQPALKKKCAVKKSYCKKVRRLVESLVKVTNIRSVI